MISNNQLKVFKSLQQKKFRKEHGLFVAEGDKLAKELLASSFDIEHVVATQGWLDKNEPDLSNECIVANAKEMERISGLNSASEVMVVCKIPDLTFNANMLQGKLSLVLDNIKDPGNLGTIIRIADWFGIANIICGAETVEAFNPKVVQATMGSITRVQVHYTNLVDLLNHNDLNLPTFGAVLGGENIYQQELPNNGLIVIGNESKGISPELLTLLDYKISIPSYGDTNGAESLNAAIATALICAEFRREL